MDADGVARVQLGSCLITGDNFEFILLVGAGQRIGSESDSVDIQACDLIEARAFEHAVGIAGVNGKAVEASGLSVGVEWNLVNLAQAEFFHLHANPSGAGALQRNLDFEFVGLRRLPLGGQNLSLLVFQRHVAHAASVGRLEVESVFASDNQRAGVFGGDDPLGGMGRAQAVMRAVESLKSPGAADRPGDFAIQVGGLERVSVNFKSTKQAVGLGGQIDAVA